MENALARPVAVGNLRMVEMILLYEASISIKGITANNIATAHIDSSFINVSPQAILRMGGMSQKKWSIWLELQKCRENI
jgi:hypothetical protein